jgi:thymidylate synthase
MTKNPYPFPTINIKNKRDNINDYIEDDIEISNYVSNNLIKMEMRK